MQPTSRHNEVLAILKEHQPCSGTDIARRCGVSSQFVNKILRELLDAGAVKCRRDGPRWLYSDAPGLPAPAPAPVPAPVVAGLGSVVVEINGAAVDRAVVEGLPSGALRSPPPRPRPDVGWREPVASDFPDLERVRKRDRVWRAVGRLARWVVRR